MTDTTTGPTTDEINEAVADCEQRAESLNTLADQVGLGRHPGETNADLAQRIENAIDEQIAECEELRSELEDIVADFGDEDA